MGSVTGRHEQSPAVNGEAPAGGGSAGEFIQRREILCVIQPGPPKKGQPVSFLHIKYVSTPGRGEGGQEKDR